MNNLDALLLDDMPQGYAKYVETCKKSLSTLIKNYFLSFPIFKEENLKFYYYDDLTLKTFVGTVPHIVLYVEIDQEENFIQSSKPKFNLIKKDSKIKNTILSLKQIKNDIHIALVDSFAPSVTLWQDYYGVNFKLEEKIGNENYNIAFRIVFGFTFNNNNGTKGIIYYNNSKKYIEIEYPKLSIQNYSKKNADTNGLYHAYVIMFKNAFMIQKQIKEYYPFEIIETLLYNVPNEMFNELTEENIYNIIDYLLSKDFKEYVTIDEQEKAFNSKYKSFSKIYAKHTLKLIKQFFNKIG